MRESSLPTSPADSSVRRLQAPAVLAVGWNSLAIELLRVGDCEEAMNVFEMALTGLSSADTMPEPPIVCACKCGVVSYDVGHSAVALDNASRAVVHSVNVDERTSPRANFTIVDEHVTSPGNTFSLYNRAFVYCDHNASLDVRRWMACLSHVHAVLLYNAGLTFHRVALANGKSEHFDRALSLYNLSMSLLNENVRRGSYAPELDVVFLALFNNIGHIRCHYFQHEELAMCLEGLGAILYQTDSKFFLTKEEWVLFDMTLLATGRQSKVAPAA